MFCSFIRGIKNLIRWFPVIWQDRDWDRGYLYILMETKLNQMQKFFDSDKTFSVDAKLYAEQIRQARELLLRVHDETVFDDYYNPCDGQYIIPIEEVNEKYQEEVNAFWDLMKNNAWDWWD